jgi:hypothetical protein
MCNIVILVVHLIVTVVRLARPGGLRSVVGESVLLKHQLCILKRGRKRAPNLHAAERAAHRDLTPRMPGPHVILDHDRPGDETTRLPTLLQWAPNTRRTRSAHAGNGRQRRALTQQISALINGRSIVEAYTKRRLPRDFSNSPPTGHGLTTGTNLSVLSGEWNWIHQCRNVHFKPLHATISLKRGSFRKRA